MCVSLCVPVAVLAKLFYRINQTIYHNEINQNYAALQEEKFLWLYAY